MKVWPVQDAEARFSEFLEASLSEGPQIVSRRGVNTAVLIPMQEWLSLRERARPGLKALLLAPQWMVPYFAVGQNSCIAGPTITSKTR